MKLSANGKKLIQSYEGLRLTAYKAVPTEKYFTIGYGHYGSDVKEGQTITKTEANNLFKKDIERFEKGVNDLVKVKINQNQYDALVSFAYNCGLGNLKSSTLLKLVNEKQFKKAGLEFPRWNKSGGRVLKGLTKRRKEEQQLFLTPVKTTVKTYYVVQKGDTLSKIAKEHKTTLQTILKKNSDIKNPDLIKPGQKIKL